MDTHVTDSRQRIISTRDLPGHIVEVRPDVVIVPGQLSATYHGRPVGAHLVHGITGRMMYEWVITCTIMGQVIGKSGRPTAEYRGASYVIRPGDTPEDWTDIPEWVLEWLDRHHPDRLEGDDEGTYLG